MERAEGEADRGRFMSTSLARARILVSSPFRVPPRFLVLGAQKAATTSLFRWLQHHPDVPTDLRKELHHFDRPRPPSNLYYRSRYPLSVRGRSRWCAGEASPEYLFMPWAAPRIAAALPAGRFIVVLREPIERARSHHALAVRRGVEDLGIAAALRAEPDRMRRAGWPTDDATGCDFHTVSWLSYLARGRYADQLERWFGLVGRERVMVLRFEDLVDDPTRFALAIQRFLGLRPVLTGDEWPAENVSGVREPLDRETEAWARSQMQDANRRLQALVGITWP